MASKPRKKSGKGRRPGYVDPDPLGRIRPLQTPEVPMAQFGSALLSMTHGSNPSVEDWRILADLVNIIMALSIEGGHMPWPQVKPLIDDATEAMVNANRRHKGGGSIRLSGTGIKAMGELMALFDECAQVLTAHEMRRARQVAADLVNKKRDDPSAVVA